MVIEDRLAREDPWQHRLPNKAFHADRPLGWAFRPWCVGPVGRCAVVTWWRADG